MTVMSRGWIRSICRELDGQMCHSRSFDMANINGKEVVGTFKAKWKRELQSDIRISEVGMVGQLQA